MQAERSFKLGYDIDSYNAKLRRIREDMGLNRKEMAEWLGISHAYYCSIERLKVYPSARVKEAIEKATKQLSEDIFPVQLKEFSKQKGSVEKDIPIEFLSLEASEETMFLPSADFTEEVESNIIKKELKTIVHNALSTLSPREENIIRLRFGIDDGKERSLEEVGKQFGITRERVRQVESKALKKLKHSRRCENLNRYAEQI